MKTNLKIALLLILSMALFQCSESRKISKSKDGKLNGTYRLTQLTSSTEGFSLNTKDAEGTLMEALALMEAEDPYFVPDTNLIKSKIRKNLEDISKFTLIFWNDGSFSQSAFVLDDTLLSPFRGKYQVVDDQLVLSTKDGKLYDRYEYFEQSNETITLVQKEYDNDSLKNELIFILEKNRQ